MDLELRGWLVAHALLAVRCFVLLRLQPHWGVMLGRLWWILAAGLSMVVAAAVELPADLLVELGERPRDAIVVAVMAEVLLGAVLGALASLPAYALLGAAAGSAAALRTSIAPFVSACVAFALATAMFMSLHHPALAVLIDHAAMLPPGRPELWLPAGDVTLDALVLGLDGLLIVALTLATPVLLSVVIFRTALGLVAAGPTGVAPLSQVVAPTVGAMAAIVALAASWAVYPGAWARAAFAATTP